MAPISDSYVMEVWVMVLIGTRFWHSWEHCTISGRKPACMLTKITICDQKACQYLFLPFPASPML